MTFSLIFSDANRGIVGGGVHSHYPFVGATVLRARAGVGVAVSQAVGEAALAEGLLGHLGDGAAPHEALAGVLRSCTYPDTRQLAVVASTGEMAVHTGRHCTPFSGEFRAPGIVAVGNLLSELAVLTSMMVAFNTAVAASHAERLVRCLVAAELAGGDLRGRQSAALVVRHDSAPWRDCDVRVDDHADPLRELARLVELRRQYALLDDPAIRAGGPALDEAVLLVRDEGWPEEVRFWLGVRLAELGRPAARDLLGPLLARNPWRMLWLRLRSQGQPPN